MRPFRFAASASPFTPFHNLVDQAKAAEDSGFDLFSLSDFPAGLSPVAALAGLAAHTERLRFSPYVSNAAFWRPDLLVREFVTADQITGGRIEIGVGAGITPGAARPVAHLRRCLEALRASFSETGGTPGWVQQRPTIMVAGAGDHLMELAAQATDTVGLGGPPRPYPELPPGEVILLSPEATQERLAVVRAAAGDRFDELELNTSPKVVLTGDRRAAIAAAQRVHSYLTEEQLRGSPKLLVGTAGEIAEQLQAHREQYGLTYFTVRGSTPQEFAPVIDALR